MYVETSKNEDTWYKALWHYDAENSVTNADNLEIVIMASRDGEIGGVLYNPSEPERQPLRPVLVLERRSVELEL